MLTVVEAKQTLDSMRTGQPIAMSDQEITSQVLADLIGNLADLNVVLAVTAAGWTEMCANEHIQNILDPVTRVERVRSGYVANIFGVAVITDGYLTPDQQFLPYKIAVYPALPLSPQMQKQLREELDPLEAQERAEWLMRKMSARPPVQTWDDPTSLGDLSAYRDKPVVLSFSALAHILYREWLEANMIAEERPDRVAQGLMGTVQGISVFTDANRPIQLQWMEQRIALYDLRSA